MRARRNEVLANEDEPSSANKSGRTGSRTLNTQNKNTSQGLLTATGSASRASASSGRRTRERSLLPSAFLTTPFFSPLSLAGDFLSSTEPDRTQAVKVEMLENTQLDESDSEEEEVDIDDLRGKSKNEEEEKGEDEDGEEGNEGEEEGEKGAEEGEEEGGQEETEGVEKEEEERKQKEREIKEYETRVRTPIGRTRSGEKGGGSEEGTVLNIIEGSQNKRRSRLEIVYESGQQLYSAARKRVRSDSKTQSRTSSTYKEGFSVRSKVGEGKVNDKVNTSNKQDRSRRRLVKIHDDLEEEVGEQKQEKEKEEKMKYPYRIALCPISCDISESQFVIDYQMRMKSHHLYVTSDANAISLFVDSLVSFLDNEKSESFIPKNQNIEILLLDQVFDDTAAFHDVDRNMFDHDKDLENKNSRISSDHQYQSIELSALDLYIEKYYKNLSYLYSDIDTFDNEKEHAEYEEQNKNQKGRQHHHQHQHEHRRQRGRIHIFTVRGSLTELGYYGLRPVDIIVNPCNWRFSSSGGRLNTMINKAIGPELEKLSKAKYGKGKKGEVYPVHLPLDNPFRMKHGVRYILQVCLWDLASMYNQGDGNKKIIAASFLEAVYERIYQKAFHILRHGDGEEVLDDDKALQVKEKEKEMLSLSASSSSSSSLQLLPSPPTTSPTGSVDKFPPYVHPSEYGISPPPLSFHNGKLGLFHFLLYVDTTEKWKEGQHPSRRKSERRRYSGKNQRENRGSYPSHNFFYARAMGKSNPNSEVPDSAVYDPWIYYQNQNIIILYDGYPKAKRHFLILPREKFLHVSKISQIKPIHLDKLRYIHRLGYKLMKEVIDPDMFPGHYISSNSIQYSYDETNLENNDSPSAPTKSRPEQQIQQEINYAALCGYHSSPSLIPLHLHCASYDLNSPCIKTKRQYNSFATNFFLSADSIEEALLIWTDVLISAADKYDSQDDNNNTEKKEKEIRDLNLSYKKKLKISLNYLENFLTSDLRCHRCGNNAIKRKIPFLREHLETCKVVRETITVEDQL